MRGLITYLDIVGLPLAEREEVAAAIHKIETDLSRNEGLSSSTRFETALKSANGLLDSLANKPDAELSIFVAVLEGETVHFSAAGECRALLCRDGKVNVIFKPTSKRKIQFTAISSGKIIKDDWLIVGSQDLEDLIDELPASVWRPSGNTDALLAGLESLPVSSFELVSGCLLSPSNNPDQRSFLPVVRQASKQLRIPPISFKISPILAKLRLLLHRAEPITRRYWLKVGTIRPPKTPSIRLRLGWKWFTALPALALVVAIIFGVVLVEKRLKKSLDTGPAPKTLLDFTQDSPKESRLVDFEKRFSVAGYEKLDQVEKKSLSKALAEAKITLIEPGDPTAELASSAVSLSATKDQLTLIDQSGTVWRYKDKLLAKIELNRNITGGTSAVWFGEDLVLGDSSGNVWLKKKKSITPRALLMPQSVPNGKKLLLNFADNLYLLDVPTGNIFKAAKFIKSLNTLTSYSNASTLGLKKIVAWAINGEVIVLEQSGSIKSFRYNQSGSVNAKIKNASSRSRLTADQTTTDIYVSNGRTILVLRHNKIIKTFYLALDEPIDEIAWKANSTLWFTSDKQLFSFNFKL